MSSSRIMLLMSYDAFCNSPPARVTEVFSLRHGEKWSVNRAVKNNGSLSKSKWWLFFFLLFTPDFLQYNQRWCYLFLSRNNKSLLFHLIKKKKRWIFFCTVLFWLIGEQLTCSDFFPVKTCALFLVGYFFSFPFLYCLQWK